jgi:bzd-type benzoyl-CoA reductase Q subunit
MPEQQQTGWRDARIDWRTGEIVSAGVDVGSVSAQAVVLVDGTLFAYANTRSGTDRPDRAHRAMTRALEDTDLRLEQLHFVVGTGSGRIDVPFVDKTVGEVHCHARGAHAIYGDAVRTILDLGGQSCKAIRCDDRGRVTSFQINDKCAAGTGRAVESFAELAQIPIEQLGPLSLRVDEDPPALSERCLVFAAREARSLLYRGWSQERVLAAFCGAVAQHSCDLLERVGVEGAFCVTGGVAKNSGVVRRIEARLGHRALEGELDPQLAGALGAALLARQRARKRRAKQR